MTAVQTRALTKKYKNKTAVDRLDLSVEEGEFFALLGVNGAGKTTTVRMLTCLSEPTSGDCLIMGHDCRRESMAVKRLCAVSPQDTSVAEKLTVRENLTMICGIYGFGREKTRSKTDEMIKLFGLAEYENSYAAVLSGGWKRKLSIAMALITEPKVLFLDEPTLGLDVLARRELWSIIEGLKGKVTLVLTTHYMEEAEQLSDRIAIMIGGKLAALGTLAELEALTGEKGLENAFVHIAGHSAKEAEI